jgi:hypothetical protein
MKNILKSLAFSALSILFFSCEDVVEVELENGVSQLVVDAFISNKNETQIIQLTKSSNFFGETEFVPAIGASVMVTNLDDNTVFVFTDDDNDGKYTFGSNVNDSITLSPDVSFSLRIEYENEVYTSVTIAKRVPTIDSINWEYVPAQLGADNGGYAAELVARDLPGATDYYWIRAYKNNVRDDRKEAINLTVDGSFSAESQNDGLLFIPPISTLVSTNFEDSLGLGDTWRYELWSISQPTYKFWQEVLNQTVDGALGALFATPTANVRTNIESSSSDPEKTAIGWFSVSLVSSEEITIVEKEGEKLSFGIN